MSARGAALILIATPIGNLGDLTPRAVEELERADAIACEDTRRTGRLLQHAAIRDSKLLTVNDHTEAAQIGPILRRLDLGQRIALVTDAGTPGISDPGERLVRAVSEAGHRVEIVPGPSALVAALVVSGLATGRFCFEGFLPRRGRSRAERLEELAAERRTVILYEAPHRLVATLVDLAAAFGAERQVAVARELTKLHEEIFRGTLGEAREWVNDGVKGEIVIVLDGAPATSTPTDDELRAALATCLESGMTTRDAVAEVAARTGVSKRAVYSLAVER